MSPNEKDSQKGDTRRLAKQYNSSVISTGRWPLMPHTMKLFERTIGESLREETYVSEEEFASMAGRQTTDITFPLR